MGEIKTSRCGEVKPWEAREKNTSVFFFSSTLFSHTFTSVSLVQGVSFFSPSLSRRDGENICKRFLSLSLSLKRSQSLSSPRVIIGMSSSAIKRKPRRAAGGEQLREETSRTATKQEDGETENAATPRRASSRTVETQTPPWENLFAGWFT